MDSLFTEPGVWSTRPNVGSIKIFTFKFMIKVMFERNFIVKVENNK